MAVFIQTKKGNVVSKNLSTNLTSGVSLTSLDDTLYALGLKIEDSNSLLDKDGEPLASGVVEAGKFITLKLGEANTRQYHVMLVAHPELSRSGQLGGVQIIEPWSTESLEFTFKAHKKVDLLSFPFLFKLYLVD